MPAKSIKQRRLMAIAEHDPDAVYPSNKGVLGMDQSQLHDFAATPEKKLPVKVDPKEKLDKVKSLRSIGPQIRIGERK